ncbi:MAG: hypothetical protein ACR2G0_05505 [Chthoniobacterales bacterium]
MNTPNRRRKLTSIPKSRWAIYAAAGAATALAYAPSAEADIHYSGAVKYPFKGTNPSGTLVSFPLNNGGALLFEHFPLGADEGEARLEIAGPEGRDGESVGAIAGSFKLYGGFYVSNLAARVNVSKLPLGAYCRQTSSGNDFHCFGGTIGYGDDGINSKFKTPGTGFIGFTFNTGAGPQYGWARIKTDGEPNFRFIVLDYAWGDPGEKIRTGQKASSRQASSVPVKGSLGFLALGSMGLVAWRKQRFPRS